MECKSIRFSKVRFPEGLNVILGVLFAAGLGVFLIGMPKCWDDWMYIKHLKGWFEATGNLPEYGASPFTTPIPWKRTFMFLHYHYLEANGRLGSLLAGIVCAWPKWIGSSICLALWILAMLSGVKSVNLDWKKTGLLPVAIALFMFEIPWTQCMGSLDFQMNYLIPAFFCIWLWRKLEKGKWPWWGFLFAGVVTGVWHEGFTLPVFCGIVALALVRRRRDKRLWAAAAGLAAAGLWLWLSPGLHSRLDTAREVSISETLWKGTVFCLPYIIGVVLLGVSAILRRRKMEVTPTMLFLLVSGAVSCVLQYAMVFAERRVGFWEDYCGVLMTLWALHHLWPKTGRQYTLGSAVLGGALALVAFMQLGIAGYWSLKYRKILNEAVAFYRGNPGKSAFGDYLPLSRMPLVAGLLPASNLFPDGESYSIYFGLPHLTYHCVPEPLRYSTPQTGDSIPGGRGLRVVEGWYFFEGGPDGPGPAHLGFSTPQGPSGMPGMLLPYVSEADGRRYTQVFPYPTPKIPEGGWWMLHFKEFPGLHVREYERMKEDNDSFRLMGSIDSIANARGF